MNEIEAQAIQEEAESFLFFVSRSESWIHHRDKADEQTFRLGIWMSVEQGVVPGQSWDKKRLITTIETTDDWEALKIFARHLVQMEGIQHIEEDAEDIQAMIDGLEDPDHEEEEIIPFVEDHEAGKIKDSGHGDIPVKEVGQYY